MIPSNKWFPTNLNDRFIWFQNFNNQLQIIGASLGLAPTDLTATSNDAEWMSFLATTSAAVDAYSDAVRLFRKTITEADLGDPIPAWPADITFTTPVAVPTGIFERLDNLVKRIRVAPAYTPEIGGILGIIPVKGDSLAPTEMKPVLKANAMPANVVEVSFVRGKTDGVSIETNVDGAGWTTIGKFFSSPAELNVPDGTGNPHSVQLRARYVDGNELIGLNSDIITVVTTP
jgi:hypothetical protein